MNKAFFKRISHDLQESQISTGVVLSMIPIAFFTYLFHESGHWAFGELMGNEMTLSLNNSTPKSGHFIREFHSLVSAMGGPLFTILQALILMIITKLTASVYAYAMVFMAAFSRFFSIVFGGISLQDEARIASMLHVSAYMVASIVLLILFFLLWRSSRILNLKWKAISYFATFGTFAMLIVIGLNALISHL
jgi:hypothetical protein